MTRTRGFSVGARVVLAVVTLASVADRFAAVANAADKPAAGVGKATAIPVNIQELMQDRRYAEAIRAIDEASDKDGAPREDLAYLRAQAMYLNKDYARAAKAFAAIETAFPKSGWVRRARFGQALALLKTGDFRAAEKIYQSEVRALLSEDRKQSFADIYLEFADVYFKPAKEGQQPDYTKAHDFYLKALEVGPKPEHRVRIELRVAECLQALGKLPEAAARFASFAKEHPKAEQIVEARYRLGEVQLAQNQLREARQTWRDLIADLPDAKSERIAEAAFNLCRTHGIPEPQSDEDLSLGVAMLEDFLKRYPDHKLAGTAFLRIAQANLHRGRHEDAVAVLKRFIADPRAADRPELADARNLLGRAYQAQKKFTEALEAWRDYLAKHPAHSAWSAVQAAIVDTEFLMGQEKFASKDYPAARELWSAFLAKYPLDPRGRAILFEFGNIHFLADKFADAIADWRRLVATHPNTDESSRGQFMIGVVLEEKLAKLDEALKEYRKVTWGAFAGQALERIARLTARSLVIATERVFRSNEVRKVRLTARNIESVTVRVYSVDLETYFRKMHLASGLESLDIALIDPDQTFEFKVPGYAEYREIGCDIPVTLDNGRPLPKSGVYAVTVSSKTLEATTMLINSDLDVVVKSSRDEVFVFAENMLAGKPWPKVKLLISNGKEVFAEAATNDDGVFQKSFTELKEAGDVRVFAVADGSVASNVVSLQGVGVSQGLTAKGYVHTDRPAYRAGQLVNVRGVVRHVAGDSYTVPKGEKYTLSIFDPRNRLVHEQEVTLGEFGSFFANVPLPPASAQGAYRIIARNKAGTSHEGSFVVHEYQLEPVRIAVKTDRKIFYRGETIEGTIAVEFYYGAPLAGREIRYQLADQPVVTATTDAAGQVKFKLPTREFRESQVLPFVVTLPERNLQLAEGFVLATKGFSIAVSTVRPLYLAGETFETTIAATDAEGKPIGTDLVLNVFEQTAVQGRIGERFVESHKVTTDAKSGAVRATLKLEKGASFVLRAEGIDRFKNIVTGSHAVTVSDDKDATRLRILADRHTFKVGENATVRLHWREEPALALVTYQGARILGYRLVQLKKGETELELPVSAALAPNFEFSVAVMADRKPDPKAKEAVKADDAQRVALGKRFHEATSPFVVEQDLRIAIAVKRAPDAKGPIRPGEDVTVVVTVTDPLGKPVSAEVSLAMVEQALLERFRDQQTPIDVFFRGLKREPAVRTTSSIVFEYRPTTKPINPRLLAEADRLEIAAVEQERWRTARELAGGLGGGMGMRDAAFAPPAPASEAAPKADVAARELASAEMDEDRGVVEEQLQKGSGVQNLARKNMVARRAFGRAGAVANRPAERSKSVALGDSNEFAAEAADSDDGSTWAFGARLGVNAAKSGRMGKNSGGDAGAGVFFQLEPKLKSVQDLADYGVPEVQVLVQNGTVRHLNLGFWDGRVNDEKAAEVVGKLVQAGARLLPNLAPQETGYWNPAVVTGKDGTATLTVTMPERSTAWKLLAKGITLETLAGQGTGELMAKKDLFGELKLPLAFTDGDDAAIVATVHNAQIDKGDITVTLKTTVGEKSTSETKKLAATIGMSEVVFKQSLRRPDAKKATSPEVEATFELIVSAGAVRDLVRRVVPIRPHGMPVYATTGGSATSDTTVWLEPPKQMTLAGSHLQIIVGPNVERSLLDIVLGPAPWCQMNAGRIVGGLDQSASDIMAAVGLLKLMNTTRQNGGPEAQALDSRIRSAVGLLVSAQNDDGGWSWSGRGGASDRYTSARVLWALALGKAAGYPVPADSFTKGGDFVAGQLAAAGENDLESRSVLLHALATAGRGDFAAANRIYRGRPSLSSNGLAYLALALLEMDRKPMAIELLDLLGKRRLDADPVREGKAFLAWNDGGPELRALFCLALQKAAFQPAKAQDLVDWLLAHRVGNRWAPEKATGPAALALCDWFAKSRFAGEHYRLAILVNNTQVKVLDIDDETGTQTVDVPADLLEKDKQRIAFAITGRGRYTFQCMLSGFVPADKLKSTTGDWWLSRTIEPAPLEFDGQEVPRGFGVLQGSYQPFKNNLTQLPVGKRGHVEINLGRHGVHAGTPAEHLEYLVVTEPLPSGATVIEQSVRGGFERFEIAPGAITFYVGSRPGIETISFDVHGYAPGNYQVGGTVLQSVYRPDRMAVVEARTLAVLPLGAKSADEYRLSPQELYELGKREFAKNRLPEAGKHLTELFTKWNLQAEVYKDSARMLLDIRLETGPAAEVVRYFEIIKEKWPDLEVPFAKILKVGAAYDELSEYERSYLVFRATAESSFLSESGVAAFLEQQGEFTRSIEVLNRLLRDYPPEAYIAGATYALAQRVYAKAPNAPADPKLREQKIYRVDLIRQAITLIDAFLTEYPEDPAADQAGFSLASALLELKAYKQAIGRCNGFAARYPRSDYLDSYWYVIGFCHFALGQHEEALAMCRKVAEAKRIDKATGNAVESPNKWRAVYILGQVYHSLGKAADAIREYLRVADRYADAKQAIDFFARKAIALPEVTTLAPGEAGVVELTFRNVPACDVKVYRIDLMKFSLLERNLQGITRINLAGIRPFFEQTLKLGDGNDYRDRTQKLELPLKQEGAYLVVCRGADLHASGLVVVTPLAVEIQEEVPSGRVRATVKNTVKGQYISDVHVKVIGAMNPDFNSGETDLRGVYVADGITGTATVIAQADGNRYAFYRGKTWLGPSSAAPNAPAAAPPPNAKPAAPQSETELLKELFDTNSGIIKQQNDNLDRLYQNKGKKGVDAKAAF